MRLLSSVFLGLAILLSEVMCAIVSYNYCDMKWGIRYAGYSAPVWTAFLTAIPFVFGIILCIFLAVFFRKKMNKNTDWKDDPGEKTLPEEV